MCVWNGWKYFLFVAVFHFPRATEERLIEICIDIYTENEYEKTEMNSDYIKPPRLKNNAIFVRSDMVMMASCWKQIMSFCILDLFQKTGVILLTCIYIFTDIISKHKTICNYFRTRQRSKQTQKSNMLFILESWQWSCRNNQNIKPFMLIHSTYHLSLSWGVSPADAPLTFNASGNTR